MIQHHITTNLYTNTPTIAVLLDVEKTFDTVWTEGLLYKKKHKHNFSTLHFKVLFQSYLTNRTFKVMVGGSFSPPCIIAAGVPQGGILSALLYNIFLADLPLPPTHLTPSDAYSTRMT